MTMDLSRSSGAEGPGMGPATIGPAIRGGGLGSLGVSMGAERMAPAQDQVAEAPRVDRARLRDLDSAGEVIRETAEIEFGNSRLFKFYVVTINARDWLRKAYDNKWFLWAMLVGIMYECGLAVFTKEDPYTRLGAAAFAMLLMAMFFKYAMFMEKHERIGEVAEQRNQERARHDEQVMRPLAEMLVMRRTDNRENQQFRQSTNTSLRSLADALLALERSDLQRSGLEAVRTTEPGVHRARLQRHLVAMGEAGAEAIRHPALTIADVTRAVEQTMENTVRTHLLHAIRPAVNNGLRIPVPEGEQQIVSVGFLNWAEEYIRDTQRRRSQGEAPPEEMVRTVERSDPATVPPPRIDTRRSTSDERAELRAMQGSEERPIQRSEGMDGSA